MPISSHGGLQTHKCNLKKSTSFYTLRKLLDASSESVFSQKCSGASNNLSSLIVMSYQPFWHCNFDLPLLYEITCIFGSIRGTLLPSLQVSFSLCPMIESCGKQSKKNHEARTVFHPQNVSLVAVEVIQRAGCPIKDLKKCHSFFHPTVRIKQEGVVVSASVLMSTLCVRYSQRPS